MQVLRAKDIQMAAVVDIERRTVLITGAIDSNEHDILIHVDLPCAGMWQVIKSETNLTDTAWICWQISFGEGTTPIIDDEAMVLSRQFAAHFVDSDRRILTFYDGEIRPGEAVLKIFKVRTTVPSIVMSHNRESYYEDMTLDDLQRRVEVGFPARSYIEAYLPVRVVDAHNRVSVLA